MRLFYTLFIQGVIPMGSYLYLEIFVIVFGLSAMTSMINKRVLGFPAAIGTPIVAAISVFLIQWAASLMTGNQFFTVNIPMIEQTIRGINFYDFLINGVICFILTASALKFKSSDLKAHWKPISILASISLMLCALLFGCIMYGYHYAIGTTIPLIVLLLLGSALGATDPIGIKGVLSSIKAPNHLMIKLEGESLFNDAMCIALFMTILNVIKGGELSFIHAAETLLFEVVVAVVIGFAFGRLALSMLRGKHDMETLIIITALLAASSYLVALYAHASAPIACVIGGLMVGNKWNEFLKENDIEEVNHFWHTIEGIINAFLFTLIGLELFILDLDAMLLFSGVLAFFVLHICRFAANYLSFALFPSVRKKSLRGSLAILSWGGVRGGISLALILAALNIPQLADYSSFILGYTFISVLLSGVVCGLGLPAVINAFYHNPNEPTEGLAGFYQKVINKMNLSGEKYMITIGPDGEEDIIKYNPTKPADESTVTESDDKF